MSFNDFGEERSNESDFKPGDFRGQNIILDDNIQDKYKGNMVEDDTPQKPELKEKPKEIQYKTKDATITEQVSSQTLSFITKFFRCLEPYFDVEPPDVMMRLKGALIPFTKSFYQSAESNPDIYGPFWVFTTIVFLITVCGNFSGYLNSEEGKFQYNFNFLPYAFLFIFGIGFGVPLVIFLVGKFAFQIDFGYVLNLCLYGYSFVILIPILLACMFPSDLLQFILLVYYTIHSSAFLLYNLYNLLATKAPNAKYVLLGILGGFQLILFFGLEFYFFKKANVQIKQQ
ncbi:MAG: YIP1 family protein [archaeon]|nr:YIP1 family protein [archaeon]